MQKKIFDFQHNLFFCVDSSSNKFKNLTLDQTIYWLKKLKYIDEWEELHMKNRAIVSLADSKYFELLNELIDSILRFKDSESISIQKVSVQ